MPTAAEARLAVYDLSGRLVRDLLGGSFAAGERTVAWDGNDNPGRRVGAGLYVVRLDTAGHHEGRRIMRLQ